MHSRGKATAEQASGVQQHGKLELDPKSIHILTVCPGLVGPRLSILGKPVLEAREVRALSVYEILKFAEKTGYWNL